MTVEVVVPELATTRPLPRASLCWSSVSSSAGGRSVADMAALRDHPELFGDVASGPTI